MRLKHLNISILAILFCVTTLILIRYISNSTQLQSTNKLLTSVGESMAEKPPTPVQEEFSTNSSVSAEDHQDDYFGYHWKDLAEGRVDAYTEHSAPFGPTSIHPILPEDLYLENIEKAKAGDSGAQFNVARALFECMTASSPDALADIEHSSAYPEHFVSALAAHSLRCQNLRSLIKENNNDWDTYYSWLAKSSAGGDPLAQAWMLAIHPQSYDSTSAKRIIFTAIETAPTEDLFALSHVPDYLANYYHNYESHYGAWTLAICKLSALNCQKDAMRANVKYQIGNPEFDEVDSLSDEIVHAIRSNRLDNLDQYFPDEIPSKNALVDPA